MASYFATDEEPKVEWKTSCECHIVSKWWHSVRRYEQYNTMHRWPIETI